MDYNETQFEGETMFKVLRRKQVQEVVRVEDLQVGDVIQYDLVTRARVKSVVPAKAQQFDNEPEYKILFEDVTSWGVRGHIWTSTLFGNMTVFAWK